ncbi:undecaprenyl-phosphate glucose phosphotransferase [Parasediminibacterium sp. JCM 36343]|uniref:undecaprenyl-phosphate glucose phosphotransferase n=1 Tax=Parasediminibacterium sp. JCM 36343 TaxID=3374279 RepID=UPI00397E5383
MNNNNSYLLKISLLCSDFVIVNASYFLAYFVTSWETRLSDQFLFGTIIFFNISWLFSSFITYLYHNNTMRFLESVLRCTIQTFLLQFLFFSAFVFYFYSTHTRYSFLIVSYVLIFFLLAMSRIYLTYIIEFIAKKSNLNKRIAIVGHNEIGIKLANYFIDHTSIYSFQGFLDVNSTKLAGIGHKNVVRKLDDCVEYAVENNITEIYSTILPEQNHEINELIESAEKNCVRVKFVTPTNELSSNLYQLEYFDNIPIVSHRPEPLHALNNRLKKRIFDVIFSLLAICFVLWWLIPIIGIIIKATSKGPIFFRQLRSGRDNKPFWCFKFRSMTVNKDSNTVQATKNDKRITPIGSFLRKSSLDEFPQFFNVILGNMSIVGPRPHMLKHTEEYSQLVDKFMLRQFMKPGITGWAQVSGYRGETNDTSLMEKRIEHDIWYMENWSLMLDIKIIFMTIINIFKGEEAAY